MARYTIEFTQDEGKALVRLAEAERRGPREQAALLIRQALERAGWLQPVQPPYAQLQDTGRAQEKAQEG